MLQKNVEWKDKVRIIGLSVDDDKEDITKRVQQKGWNLIEHYTLGGWDGDHHLVKGFKI